LPNGAIIWRQLSEPLWKSNLPEEAQAGGAVGVLILPFSCALSGVVCLPKTLCLAGFKPVKLSCCGGFCWWSACKLSVSFLYAVNVLTSYALF